MIIKPNTMRNQFTFVLCMLSAASYAQVAEPCQKIGYANVQLIAQQLPETRQMEAELASLGGQLQNQLNARYADFNKKLRDFESPATVADEALKLKRRDELMRLEQEIRKFAANSWIIGWHLRPSGSHANFSSGGRDRHHPSIQAARQAGD